VSQVEAGTSQGDSPRPAELLRAEAEALIAAADRLDEQAFDRAVKLLAACTGKAILTGAGTSGIIARKLAATMTSTGMPALFLHPNDALHGGLGVVSEHDVVVAISNSGNTAELLGLLPYLRHRGVAIIAIVGDLSSRLAEAADVSLDAGAAVEICPFNLAPTSSTTVALAIGDALAVTLYGHRGLTPELFAINHPSGSLGRRLTLRVSDVMRDLDSTPTVARSDLWLIVIEAISGGGMGATLVVDEQRSLEGIVTDGDLRRAIQRSTPEDLASLTAGDIMTPSPEVARPDALVHEALQQMEDRPSQISVLPVVDGDRCVGMVRVHDLVRAGG